MIDISLRIMMFMWISSFMLLAGQYVMADVLNMTLTNAQGDRLESELLNYIDTAAFNNATQNILRGECDASAQVLPTHGYYLVGYNVGGITHAYMINSVLINQDSFVPQRPETVNLRYYTGTHVWLLEHGPEFDINTQPGTLLRDLIDVTVVSTETGNRRYTQTYTFNITGVLPELKQNTLDRTGTWQYIDDTIPLALGSFLGNVVDDSCAARNPDGTLSTERQFDRVQDFGVSAAFVGWELVQLLSGTYIFNILALFGVPTFIVAAFVFMYIALLARTIIGYIRGV